MDYTIIRNTPDIADKFIKPDLTFDFGDVIIKFSQMSESGLPCYACIDGFIKPLYVYMDPAYVATITTRQSALLALYKEWVTGVKSLFPTLLGCDNPVGEIMILHYCNTINF